MTAALHGWRGQVSLLAALGAARLTWSLPMSLCLGMTAGQCLGTAVALVAAIGVLATVGRAAWLAARTATAVRALRIVPMPPRLRAAQARTAVPEVRCVADGEPSAFCAGLLRPRVHVTDGLVESLPDAQLDAVLLHEAEHARRRDPLRRLAHRALADAGFLVPLLGWWAARHQERAEVRADRAAIAVVGARPVAAALLTVGAAPSMAAATGFDGGTRARVAQLLGDDPPRQAPSLPVCLLSLANAAILVSLAMCVVQALPIAA